MSVEPKASNKIEPKASNTEPKVHCGFVAIVGRPNVGKSTLLNRVLGQKIAIVSDHPQTTRNRILGVYHRPDAQIVFLDTPGVHRPRHSLDRRMMAAAEEAVEGVDLVLMMVDATREPGLPEELLLRRLEKVSAPVFLALNKIDRVAKEALLPLIDRYRKLRDFAEFVPVSALQGENVDRLVDTIVRYLPEGSPYFPEDFVTDQPIRFLAGEVIREKLLKRSREEIPHAIGVTVEEFVEPKASTQVEPKASTPNETQGLIRIRAVILVEKESQKRIVIGLLKDAGTEARLELEALLGTRVFLDLWVKVREDWRGDDRVLDELGYGR